MQRSCAGIDLVSCRALAIEVNSEDLKIRCCYERSQVRVQRKKGNYDPQVNMSALR